MAHRQSGHGKDDEGDDYRRHGGNQHVAYVGEEFGTRGRRGEHGGVGERRNFVAEVGPRDDGAGNPSRVESHGLAYAQQGYPYGGDGGPGAARDDRDNGADDAARGQEETRREDVQTVGDERGHHTAEHPGARDGPDEQQDDDGRGHLLDVFGHTLLEYAPFVVVTPHGQGHAHGRSDKQRHLAATHQGIAPEDGDDHGQQGHQYDQRDDSDKGSRYFGFLVHVGSILISFANVIIMQIKGGVFRDYLNIYTYFIGLCNKYTFIYRKKACIWALITSINLLEFLYCLSALSVVILNG